MHKDTHVIKINVSLFRPCEATLNPILKLKKKLLILCYMTLFGSDVLHNWVKFVGCWTSTGP